jgi:cyclase
MTLVSSARRLDHAILWTAPLGFWTAFKQAGFPTRNSANDMIVCRSMIRKSMPSGRDPMVGTGFSSGQTPSVCPEIMLKPRDEKRKMSVREIFMLRVAMAVVATTVLLAGAAIAQQAPPPVDFSKVEIKTTDIGDNVYMLEGQGGNITVAVAKDGIIMVDGEFAPLHDKIKAAIATISNQPIKYLINTHFHGDHTGGNELFAKDGAAIVSEINVKNRLAAGTTNGLTGVKTPPAPADALPSKTYTGALEIRLRGRVADLKHIANAHTDGDTYIWFKTANVLSTGDTFTNGRYPNIDFANGGNIKGMIAATDAYMKLTNAKTRIVPGHGPLGDKAALMEYRTMLVTARDRMAKLVKEGKSEDEVVAAKPFADLDAKWAPTELASKNFIRVVYHSLADDKGTKKGT